MNISSSILFVLLYGDVFQYPYTREELIGWLPKRIWPKTHIEKQLKNLIRRKKIIYEAPFYVMNGKRSWIKKRMEREYAAYRKWNIAERAASLLRYIPTILLVGVTGGLAIFNTDEEDDIDFYICSKKNTLWITRLVSTILIELFFFRRHPGDRCVKDTICLNMFVSEENLTVPDEEQDLYTAHEILQMKPLWDRHQTYRNFLKENAWALTVFPNKQKEMAGKGQSRHDLIYPSVKNWIVEKILRILEKPSRHAQLWYMRKKRTTEVISDTVIRFHPYDARLRTNARIRLRMKRHHLPLDKNFFQT